MCAVYIYMNMWDEQERKRKMIDIDYRFIIDGSIINKCTCYLTLCQCGQRKCQRPAVRQ